MCNYNDYVIDFDYPWIPPLYFVWFARPTFIIQRRFFIGLSLSPLAYTILPSSAGGGNVSIKAVSNFSAKQLWRNLIFPSNYGHN